MKKNLLFILKLICIVWGSVFYIGSLGGLILCFTDSVNLLTLNLILTIALFCLGTLMFYVSLKKLNYHNNISTPDISITENEPFSTEKHGHRTSSVNDDSYTKMPNTNSTAQTNGYIETNNIIYRTDNRSISDEEVPYLIQVGYEKALKSEYESVNPKFHRTPHEKDLSFNFWMKYGYEVDSLTENFESLYRDTYKTDDLSERISLLKEAITAFEKAKKFCYSKGKGGTIYFQDMWEHMHNSQNQCFSYLDNIKNSLNEAVFEKDIAIPEIINTVSENDGILQKNVYELLPNIDKSTIQRIIRRLESNNKLSRIKKGNSYELHLIN